MALYTDQTHKLEMSKKTYMTSHGLTMMVSLADMVHQTIDLYFQVSREGFTFRPRVDYRVRLDGRLSESEYIKIGTGTVYNYHDQYCERMRFDILARYNHRTSSHDNDWVVKLEWQD